MTNLTDYQKKELDALGDDPIKASLQIHRKKLGKVADKALEQIDEQLPDMSPTETIKAYDTSMRHLNTLDGRNNNENNNVFFILPGELANPIKQRIEDEAAKQQQQESPSMPIKHTINVNDQPEECTISSSTGDTSER